MKSSQSDILTQAYLDRVNTAAAEFVPPRGFITKVAEFMGYSRTTVNRWFSGTASNAPLVDYSKWEDKTRREGYPMTDKDRKRLLLGQLLEGGITRNYDKFTGESKTREMKSDKEWDGSLIQAFKMAWETQTRKDEMRFYSAAFTSLELEQVNGKWQLKIEYNEKIYGDDSTDIGNPEYQDTDEESEDWFSSLECREFIAPANSL